MDEFQPPDELTDLWLGPSRPPEDAAAITERVLMDAKRYGSNIRRFDDAWIVVSIILLPMLFLAGSLESTAYLSLAFIIADLIFNLAVYWMFYRAAPSEPDSAAAPLREYVGYWLGYLHRRAQFYRISAWGSMFMFGAAGARLSSGVSDPKNLWMAGVFLLSTVLGLWCTWHELRKFAGRQANLQRILDDLGSGPEHPM
jgi:hypothetical protein